MFRRKVLVLVEAGLPPAHRDLRLIRPHPNPVLEREVDAAPAPAGGGPTGRDGLGGHGGGAALPRGSQDGAQLEEGVCGSRPRRPGPGPSTLVVAGAGA